MNFSDLLDEDGQGTRRCDAWLAENIEGYEVREGYAEEHLVVLQEADDENKQLEALSELPRYTTGDSIDPILDLAKDYFSNYLGFQQNWSIQYGNKGVFVELYDEEITTNQYEKEQTAIAETLFKAYQKENAITTKEAVEKYDDPKNSFPPKGDE